MLADLRAIETKRKKTRHVLEKYVVGPDGVDPGKSIQHEIALDVIRLFPDIQGRMRLATRE